MRCSWHRRPRSEVIKYVGAVYLVYLGIRVWRTADTRLVTESRPLAASGWARYRTGMLVSLSNPKAILFCVAFFPQFIDRRQALAPQASILLITFAVIETLLDARLCRWRSKAGRVAANRKSHALVQPRLRGRVHRSRRSARHIQAVTRESRRLPHA